MTDPFDTLRGELVRASARLELAAPRRRWAWLRPRSHPAAVVIAVLVMCATAAAAAISLTANRSQPLSGRVPGRVQPSRGTGPISVAGYRYSIRVTPNLSTGSAGWAVWTTYHGPPFGGGGGGGGGAASQRRLPRSFRAAGSRRGASPAAPRARATRSGSLSLARRSRPCESGTAGFAPSRHLFSRPATARRCSSWRRAGRSRWSAGEQGSRSSTACGCPN